MLITISLIWWFFNLGALEDFSIEVREGLYKMLASCSLETTTCLKMCIEKILDNLRKYPQDKKSTYRCMQSIGGNHADVTLPLVPELLSVHPFFDTPEPDVEDPLCKFFNGFTNVNFKFKAPKL